MRQISLWLFVTYFYLVMTVSVVSLFEAVEVCNLDKVVEILSYGAIRDINMLARTYILFLVHCQLDLLLILPQVFREVWT